MQALTLDVQLHHLLRGPSLVLCLARQVVQVVFGGNVAEVKDHLHRRAPDPLLRRPAGGSTQSGRVNAARSRLCMHHLGWTGIQLILPNHREDDGFNRDTIEGRSNPGAASITWVRKAEWSSAVRHLTAGVGLPVT